MILDIGYLLSTADKIPNEPLEGFDDFELNLPGDWFWLPFGDMNVGLAMSEHLEKKLLSRSYQTFFFVTNAEASGMCTKHIIAINEKA